jgi:hypothetical protein
MMKIAKQIASFIGLKPAARQPASTPKPAARPASTPNGTLQGLAKRTAQAGQTTTATAREGLARPRVATSTLRLTRPGYGGTDAEVKRIKNLPSPALPLKTQLRFDALKAATAAANARANPAARPTAGKQAGETAAPSRQQGVPSASQRIAPRGVKKIVLPTRPAPPPPEGAAAGTQRVAPTGIKKIVVPSRPAPPPPVVAGSAPHAEAAAAGKIAAPTDHAPSSEDASSAKPPATPKKPPVTPEKPSVSAEKPAATPLEGQDTPDVDHDARQQVAELGKQVHERIDSMHNAAAAEPSEVSSERLLQEAAALHELALLISSLLRQLIQRGGQAMVSLTAS